MVYPERRFIMDKKKEFGPGKVGMFVDYDQVGKTKFYGDAKVNNAKSSSMKASSTKWVPDVKEFY